MKLIVESGYRIHINSIDMNGFSGRCCGGLGFALGTPKLKIEVETSKIDDFDNNYKNIVKIVNIIRDKYKINKKYKVRILTKIYEHKGLGFGTQLMFLLTTAILKLDNRKVNVDNIASVLNLAGVSGIGYGAYKYGGFIVDSGYELGINKRDFIDHSTIPPKIIYHGKIPKNWKVLLFIPKEVASISDKEENEFFAECTPVPIDEVKTITYYTLMGILPAINEESFENFIKSLKKITSIGTKKAELKINASVTAKLLSNIENKFNFAALSSLGPTCYTFIDAKKTHINIKSLRQEFNDCEIIYTSVRNKRYHLENIYEKDN